MGAGIASTSAPQNRHLTAAHLIVSAQYGHDRVSKETAGVGVGTFLFPNTTSSTPIISAMPAMIVRCSLAAMRPMLFTRSPDMVPTVVSMASALMSTTAPTTSARIPRVRIHCSPQQLWKGLDSTISRAASKPSARPAETERAPEGALSMPFTAHAYPFYAKGQQFHAHAEAPFCQFSSLAQYFLTCAAEPSPSHRKPANSTPALQPSPLR